MIRKLLRRVTGVETLGAWTHQQLAGVRTSVAAAEKHGKSTGKRLKELRETVALERRNAAEAHAAIAAQRNEIEALSARLAQVERLADANERLAKLLYRLKTLPGLFCQAPPYNALERGRPLDRLWVVAQHGTEHIGR